MSNGYSPPGGATGDKNPLSHARAAEIVREEFPKIHGREATDNEVLYILAVGWIETHYGRTGQFAHLAEQGMFNWANIEKRTSNGACPNGWAAGKDHDGAGNLVDVCFQVFPSDNLAANALIRTLTKRHWPVLEAIAIDPSPESVAHAMKASPVYYVAPESQYALGLKNAVAAIRKGGNASPDLNSNIHRFTPEFEFETAKKGASIFGLIAIGLGGAAVAHWYYNDKRR